MEIHNLDIIGGISIEIVDNLPIWDADNIGRIIYVKSIDNYYFGLNNGWKKLTDDIYKHINILGGTGRVGGTGCQGGTGNTGSTGRTGGSGGTGGTGCPGNTGGTGGSGGSGGTGGTGGFNPISYTGGTGGVGTSGGTGVSGGTGNTGPAGALGCIFGERESGTTLSLCNITITGIDNNSISVEMKNQYNSFDIDSVILTPGNMIDNILFTSDKLSIVLYRDMFYPKLPKSAILNIAYSNIEKNVQVYIDNNFSIKIFSPLNGQFQEIVPFIPPNKSITLQLLYIISYGSLIVVEDSCECEDEF